MDEQNTQNKNEMNRVSHQSPHTLDFPAIQETTEAENAAIDALIAKATAVSNDSETEVISFWEEERRSIEEEPGEPPRKEKKEKPVKSFPPIPSFKGLLPAAEERYQDSPFKRRAYTALVATGLLLALALTLVLMAALYVFSISALLFVSLLLLLICAALIVAGLAGLCHGIVLLFSQGILIALIEIGLALIVFGIILALSALAGEVATAQLPRLIRYLSRLFCYLIMYLLSFVFGSQRFRREPKEVKTA